MGDNTQLTQIQRYQIRALMKAGHNQTKTARLAGTSGRLISTGTYKANPIQLNIPRVDRKHIDKISA